MPEDIFQQGLNNPAESKPANEEIIKEIENISDDEYYAAIRKKNEKNLIKLDFLEKERIAAYIVCLYDKEKQAGIADKIDGYDDVYRMRRVNNPGQDEDTPNYRSPLSTVTLEVVHANTMNVFFTPKDILRVLPVEEGDIPKIKRLDIFANWSLENEMKIEESIDRLFHSSAKNGECPYIVSWEKEYGTEIIIEPLMNPVNPSEPLLDEVTGEVVYQEREKSKLLYNGPKLEIFSRKDYIQPDNAMDGKTPDWEMRRLRINADKVLRYEREGKFYQNTYDSIEGWENTGTEENKIDTEGETIPLGKGEKVFVEFYGNLRINAVKTDKQDEEQFEEMENEFIAIVEIESQTLCALRKNKFPLKMRPIGIDMFIPDDEGRRRGTGIIEFMDGPQKAYDGLFNQYLFATIQANDPFGFYAPTSNMRDKPMKIKHGYLYPSSDPGSINIVKLPPPNASLPNIMGEVRNWGQLLFGISDYASGIESQIDPRAPAKKAEVVLAQGNVRLNLIIKRKNRTLQDIAKRWFLLYQANMPPNKFMRIAGADQDTPWQFTKMNITDFALNSIPDFELTGNILNSNKTLEVNKALAIYNVLSQNIFFSPQSAQGLQSLHALTKWLMDKLDETGISHFLPSVPASKVDTPQEENAKFLQGDDGDPEEKEDHIGHMQEHNVLIFDPAVPSDTKKQVILHNAKHAGMLKNQITLQLAQAGQSPVSAQAIPAGGQPGGLNEQSLTGGVPAQGNTASTFPVAGMG